MANNHGGARKGAGRKAGGKNANTPEVRTERIMFRATPSEKKELEKELKKIDGKVRIEKILKALKNMNSNTTKKKK